MANKRAILLMGPTAAGKTAIALSLANHLPIEIISVDSALIYRGLDIGSAKPSLSELSQVPHHLIDILSPLENYSVADFLKDCNQCISDICGRGKLPVLTGGTMMYFNALVNGISELPEANPEIRQQLEIDFDKNGNLFMHQRLMALDPISAAKINSNDRQRIERALEVYYICGKPISIMQKEKRIPGLPDCEYLSLGIMPTNRELLHQRINQRFDLMLKTGLTDEVANLRIQYPELTDKHNSMRTVGYSQVWSYLEGIIDYESLRMEGMAATRQLAKRQFTWLRSLPLQVIDDPQLNQDILLQKTLDLISNWIY